MDFEQLKARQFSREEHRQMLIKNLGIFELRALARELGVESPTTKKRDQLLDLILDQIYNNESTVVKKTNRGRPFKKLTNLDNIITQVTGSDATDYLISRQRPIRYEELVHFAQDVPVFSQVDECQGEFEGIVRSSPQVSYFLDLKTDNKVFFRKDDVNNFNVQAGDIVKTDAKKINSDNQFIVTQIHSIDGENPDDYQGDYSGPSKPIISTNTLDYGTFKLYEGRRNLIKNVNNLFENDDFLAFARYCEKNDYNLITLGLETSFEDQIMLSTFDNVTNLATTYGSGYDIGFDRVVDAISHAQRVLSRGKKCVLFVYDIVGLVSLLDQCFVEPESVNGHNARAIIVAQKLISLGRAHENGSSLTIVLTSRAANENDAFLKNELEKICTIFE